MTRKIILAAMLSTLAVTGLAIGGDGKQVGSAACDPKNCPAPCEPCPLPCADGSAASCSITG